jgi:hypothetical protein
MLLAGIQAEFGLDPRLKHSGVTILASRISSLQPQFSKQGTKRTKKEKIDQTNECFSKPSFPWLS